MSDDESLDFEQDVLNDNNLLKEVELTYRLKRGLASRQQKLYKTTEWRYKKRNRIIRFSAVVSVAAVFMFGLFIMYPGKDAVDEELLAEKEISVSEKNLQEAGAAVGTIRKSIAEGRDKEAVDIIGDMEKNNVIPALSDVSCAHFVVNGDLSDVEADSLIREAYELHWLKICSLIKIGRKDEAKGLLKMFVSIKGQYKEKADSVLQMLDK